MPTSSQPSIPKKAGIDWFGVKKTFLVQIVVLLAVSGAAIGYINWSSSVAQAEFAGAMKLMMADPAPPSKPSSERSFGAQNQRRPSPVAVR